MKERPVPQNLTFQLECRERAVLGVDQGQIQIIGHRLQPTLEEASRRTVDRIIRDEHLLRTRFEDELGDHTQTLRMGRGGERGWTIERDVRLQEDDITFLNEALDSAQRVNRRPGRGGTVHPVGNTEIILNFRGGGGETGQRQPLLFLKSGDEMMPLPERERAAQTARSHHAREERVLHEFPAGHAFAFGMISSRAMFVPGYSW